MSAEQAPEPTMDEILASIRRIISDEPSRNDVSAGAGQIESEMGSGSVADDIARALNSGVESQEPENNSTAQDTEDDIFQLTDEQVAVVQQPQSGMGSFTEPQEIGRAIQDPVNEMEQALKDPFSSDPLAMQDSGDNSLNIDQVDQPINLDDLARDGAREIDPLTGSGPDVKNPVSPVFDPPRTEPSDDQSGSQFVSPDHMDIKKSFEDLKENFDPEIGSPMSGNIEESNAAESIKSKSPLDDVFEIASDVGESDIAEANELLSGFSNENAGESMASRDDSGALPEPPPLASALEQADAAPMAKSDPLDMSSLEVGINRADPLADPLQERPVFTAEPEDENRHSRNQENKMSLEPTSDLDENSGKGPDQYDDQPELISGDRSPVEAAMDPSSSSNGFEQGMRDMLRPMIQNWLDDNLPRLVEGAIKDELESRMGKK